MAFPIGAIAGDLHSVGNQRYEYNGVAWDIVGTVSGDALATIQAEVDAAAPQVTTYTKTEVDASELLRVPKTGVQDTDDWNGVAYIDPDAIGANPTAKIYPDGTVVGSTDNGEYAKYPSGMLKWWGKGTLTITAATNGYTTLTLPIVPINTDYYTTADLDEAVDSYPFVCYASRNFATTAIYKFYNIIDATARTGSQTFNTFGIGRWK